VWVMIGRASTVCLWTVYDRNTSIFTMGSKGLGVDGVFWSHGMVLFS
jgi:hypothetical protein